jgi:hypothetical protein
VKRSVVYTEDEIVNRLHDVHGDRVIMVGRYVNMKTKIMWRHIDYGDWVSTPDHVINRGHSHPSIPRKSRKIDRTCVQCGCSTSYSKWHSGPTCHNCYIKVYNKTRLSLNNRLSMRMRTRMWSAIKNSSKSGSTRDLLG